MANLQKQHAKLVVAPEGTEIAKDDFAVIDFKGTVDGVAFEGGEGKSYPLQIGSGSFVARSQLIGCKAGDEKDVKSPSRKITEKSGWQRSCRPPLKSTT